MKSWRFRMILQLGLCAWAVPCLAQSTDRTFATISVSAQADGTTPSAETLSDESFDAAAMAAWSVIDIGPRPGTAIAQATARADTGDLALSIKAQSFGAGFGEARAEAAAEWRDGFTLSAPTLSRGDSIKFDFLIFPKGGFHADATSAPHPSGIDSVGGANGSLEIHAFNLQGSIDSMGSCLNSACAIRAFSPPPLPTNIDIPVPNLIRATMTTPNDIGNLLTIFARLKGSVISGLGTEAEISGTFSGSIHWGGIENVRNALTDAPILNWTITSDSGFDYSRSFDEQQIPEPASLTLMLIALYTPLMTRRRGRAAI